MEPRQGSGLAASHEPPRSIQQQGYHYKRKNGALLCSAHFYMPVICSFHPTGGASAELRKLRLLARTARVLATGKVTTKKTDSKRCPFRGDPFEVKGELFTSSNVTVLLWPL